jgi:hypothetical protein
MNGGESSAEIYEKLFTPNPALLEVPTSKTADLSV